MTQIAIRVGKGGSLRYIHNDDFEVQGTVPRRASHVEPIPSGPLAGQWFVDMSPLGTKYQYCLWPPYKTRREGLAAEVAHLEEVWIRGRLD